MKSSVRLIVACLSLSALTIISVGQVNAEGVNPDALVGKIQNEVSIPFLGIKADPNIPHGEFLNGRVVNSKIYPGTDDNGFNVYVPAQYDPAKPACLLIKPDGLGFDEGNILDSLIANKEVPVIISLGVGHGAVFNGPVGTANRHATQYNRSYKFDSMNDRFADYVLNEVLPAAQKLKTRDGRAIHLSPDGNDHAAWGASTDGIGAFTLAWQRPDQFTRVYAVIGTFVSMRGGHEYPALIRKTEPKTFRIFMEDGTTDSWNLLFGSWYEENLRMESALKFAGYDVAHAWGVHGHDPRPGMAIFADVMRWLWRDYPSPIKAGTSRNSTLQEITVPQEGWRKVSQTFQSAAGLTANPKGDVYLSDAPAGAIYRFGGQDAAPSVFLKQGSGIIGQAFGPDGILYGIVPREKKIVALDSHGKTIRTIAEGITGHGIVVTHDGTLYITEPGEHSDMPSQIWQIKPNGEKKVVDQGIYAASGVAVGSDGSLFYVAEKNTKWIYSYAIQPDGSLASKQAYFWLHLADIPNDGGTEDLAVDMNHNLYAATPMGIQICDFNGRVRAILPLPTPCGPVRSLCFGGEHFDILYATDGTQVFTRRLKVPGFAPWSAPIPYATNNSSFNPPINPY